MLLDFPPVEDGIIIFVKQSTCLLEYNSVELIQVALSDGGIVVSIAAFQAVDPGSIPGWRMFWLIFLTNIDQISMFLTGPLA